ncbi:MAG: tRNA pseudouridine synthase B [Candidatus Xenolissoclinum pacificiensis L6]|uniref:tRNA pseudouridine synthase B n=1 Tax=Candidatus Xenolissoclinum pacificiensis L6 TaxID=1401685 RepID=W2UZA5_9RICK|nr:MAG: tRNA pseudouridine synthase B [Candidatus Xenolissoclinum pacificiensis L6]
MKMNVNAWINLNKIPDHSSYDMVRILKRRFNSKMGYLGTLDPIATGVLPVGLGTATKLIYYCDNMDKSYTFTIQWGIDYDSIDRTGNIIGTCQKRFSILEIDAVIPKFIGYIEQVPPRFSAVKINGVRAYSLMRKGITDFDIKGRMVNVYDLRILSHTGEKTTFFMHCGKGVYVRSIIRDIANNLGGLAHVVELRRDHVGPFLLENAEDPNSSTRFYPLDYILDKNFQLNMSRDDALNILQGKTVNYSESLEDGKTYYAKSREFLMMMRYEQDMLIPKKNVRIEPEFIL